MVIKLHTKFNKRLKSRYTTDVLEADHVIVFIRKLDITAMSMSSMRKKDHCDTYKLEIGMTPMAIDFF